MSQLPNAVYTEVARNFGAASNLPAGVYTAHAMTTSLKTIVTPDTGMWAGRRNPRLKQIVASSGSFIGYRDTLHLNHRVINFPSGVTARLLIGGNSGLPAGVYTAHVMSVSTKTIVTPDTSSWFGHREFRFKLIYDGSVACSVIGNVHTSIALPQPQGCSVQGQINLTLAPLTGISMVLGQASTTGDIAVTFQPVSTSSCQVLGNINALFLQRSGQDEACISGPPNPDLGASTPKNFVY